MTEDVHRALQEAQEWMQDEQVVAVAEGEEDGRSVIVVYVAGGVAADRFPGNLHDVPVVVRDSGGEIVAQPEAGGGAGG